MLLSVADYDAQVILAVYYTFADIVLLGQCFYYEGFTLKDKINKPGSANDSNGDAERRPLLRADGNDDRRGRHRNGRHRISDADRRRSSSAFRERFLSIDGTHLSPATPMVPDSDPTDPPETSSSRPQSTLQAVIFNIFVIILVCAAGVFGWWLSSRNDRDQPTDGGDEPSEKHEALKFNILGQVFGYICAVLYLGSRIPQLLLNYRRKSTEGISMLFFLFACIGNLTYVLSISAYSPICKHPRHCEPGEARAIYARYIAVNFSWLLGSAGTLFLDASVFVQYFMYRKDEDDGDGDDTSEESDDPPLLGREERGSNGNVHS